MEHDVGSMLDLNVEIVEMRKLIHETICPRCLSAGLKSWSELTADERLVFARHPATARIPLERRKKHRFCTRCLFSDGIGRETTA
jgi:hypothetical protein